MGVRSSDGITVLFVPVEAQNALGEPQIQEGHWYEVDTNFGTEYVWAEYVQDEDYGVLPFLNGTVVYKYQKIYGFGARFSWAGTLGCTEWVVFDTQEKATEYLNSEIVTFVYS